jgi:hypothetical protein
VGRDATVQQAECRRQIKRTLSCRAGGKADVAMPRRTVPVRPERSASEVER